MAQLDSARLQDRADLRRRLEELHARIAEQKAELESSKPELQRKLEEAYGHHRTVLNARLEKLESQLDALTSRSLGDGTMRQWVDEARRRLAEHDAHLKALRLQLSGR